jgi:hypothetical protein
MERDLSVREVVASNRGCVSRLCSKVGRFCRLSFPVQAARILGTDVGFAGAAGNVIGTN